MRMVILGICGRMGEQLYTYFKERFTILGIDVKQHRTVPTYAALEEISDPIDVMVDFSSPSAEPIVRSAIEKRIPVLSGTTGYKKEVIQSLQEEASSCQTIFYWSANYAKGIQLFRKLIDLCQKEFAIFDFVEIHATTKKDAPSGTAKMFAEQLNIDENKIQSLRLYQAPAIHELIFASQDERIIIRHEVIHTHAFLTGFDELLQKIMKGEAIC
ncbi:MAG TPA: hypothetical protein IAD46_04395 [Candidatus Pelethenecus faecipullorum]|uniref:4-hydroxy-tetrahydrodipicolinate reductase n=1 Tax=Candidatus Pelethenecus faecipullorum TaxID=2840900 RepID=A0A9D1GQX8_9MOLU|nr:hypothetical protein [Candidatus Pelethenecus faecipullorum]